jgi:hypothetical protein
VRQSWEGAVAPRGRHAPTGQEQQSLGQSGAGLRSDGALPNACRAPRNDAPGEPAKSSANLEPLHRSIHPRSIKPAHCRDRNNPRLASPAGQRRGEPSPPPFWVKRQSWKSPSLPKWRQTPIPTGERSQCVAECGSPCHWLSEPSASHHHRRSDWRAEPVGGGMWLPVPLAERAECVSPSSKIRLASGASAKLALAPIGFPGTG